MTRATPLVALVVAAGVARADDTGIDAGIDAGDAAGVTLTADPPIAEPASPRPSWRRTAGEVAMGAGAAVLISAAAMVAFRFVDDQKTRDAEDASGVLPVFLVGGGAAAAVGLVLWFTAPIQPAGVVLVPAVAPGTATFTLEGRF